MAASGMSRWAGKTALITGVSLGIGKEVAKKLLESGVRVIGCARNADNLKAAKDDLASAGTMETIQCDISKETEVNAMFELINSSFGGVDIVVNNAGLAKCSPIITGSVEDWRLMYDVNVLGLLMVTKEGIKSMKMKSSQECHIININSLSGHRVVSNPDSHIYSSTKFAVTAITTGLRNELLTDPLNCRVSQVCPGLVDTPFLTSQYGDEKAKQLLSNWKTISAEEVSEAVIFQLALPPHVQVQDVMMRHVEQVS